MLSIRWGLFLTTGLGFLPIFAVLYTNVPVSVDRILWISYSTCVSLAISVGLAFMALMFLFSRGAKNLFEITCGMMIYALMMGLLLSSFRFSNIEFSVVIFGTLASVEIAFVFVRGLVLLEDMRRALYPDHL